MIRLSGWSLALASGQDMRITFALPMNAVKSFDTVLDGQRGKDRGLCRKATERPPPKRVVTRLLTVGYRNFAVLRAVITFGPHAEYRLIETTYDLVVPPGSIRP